MVTTNLFTIADVRQMRTNVVLEFYCLFFRNILVCWRRKFRNSFNSFHNRVEFGTIFLEGLRNFGGEGSLNTQNPPPGTPLLIMLRLEKKTRLLKEQTLINVLGSCDRAS